MNYNKYMIIFPALALIACVIIVFFYDYNCARESDMRKKQINGIVTSKYIDSHQHDFPRIDYRNTDGDIKNIYISNELNGVYGLIEIGDTIFKSSHSLKIVIKKTNEKIDTVFNFNCK